MIYVTTPLSKKCLSNVRAGEQVFLSGTMYTARDQAHKRLVAALKKGKKLPLDVKGQVIYYCGPTKTPKGRVIGSCGPTTSSRMDSFTPALLKAGLVAMIGKGRRSQEVAQAIKKYRGVYFVTYAGCGALLSTCVKKAKAVAFKDLGPEAIFELEAENFPLIVGIDSRGGSIYEEANTTIK